MALEGYLGVLFRHPGPIIRYPDQTPACLFDVDQDLGRTGIDRVFNKFFNRRCGPVNHFTRGNLVHNVIWEYIDFIRHTNTVSTGIEHHEKRSIPCGMMGTQPAPVFRVQLL
jgi:hypothetical protein